MPFDAFQKTIVRAWTYTTNLFYTVRMNTARSVFAGKT